MYTTLISSGLYTKENNSTCSFNHMILALTFLSCFNTKYKCRRMNINIKIFKKNGRITKMKMDDRNSFHVRIHVVLLSRDGRMKIPTENFIGISTRLSLGWEYEI